MARLKAAKKPSFGDLLQVTEKQRGFYIQQAMLNEARPLRVGEIGQLARELDHRGAPKVNKKTYGYASVYQHLSWMAERDGVEQLADKRWQLTSKLVEILKGKRSTQALSIDGSLMDSNVRYVDSKCRLLLPKGFANSTVTVQQISESEIRVQKAAVVPIADMPFIEESLKPLSDRDRDLFLDLLDNPPKAGPVFRAAAAKYKKEYGRPKD